MRYRVPVVVHVEAENITCASSRAADAASKAGFREEDVEMGDMPITKSSLHHGVYVVPLLVTVEASDQAFAISKAGVAFYKAGYGYGFAGEPTPVPDEPAAVLDVS